MASKKRGRTTSETTGSATSTTTTTTIAIATASATPSSVTSTTSSSSFFKYDTQGSGSKATSEFKVISNTIQNSNFDKVDAVTTSSATAPLSSSNVYASSTGSTEDTASYSNTTYNASNPSERINPFDKNNKTQDKHVDGVSVNQTSSAIVSVEKNLDNLTKNRFEKYQGIQNQTTGRYVPSSDVTEESKKSSTVTNITSNPSYMLEDRQLSNERIGTKVEAILSTTTTTTTTTTSTNVSKLSDAAKYSFGSASSYSRSSSVSDADIIFGDIAGNKGSNHSSFERTYSTASAPTQKRSYGGYNRSLSVSSEKDGDFSNDPRVNTSYRVYEGIQNAGFTDFESPVKTITPPATGGDDDEYDLK